MVSPGPGVIIHNPLFEKIVHPDSSSIMGHMYSALFVLIKAHPAAIFVEIVRLSNVIIGFLYGFFNFHFTSLSQRHILIPNIAKIALIKA